MQKEEIKVVKDDLFYNYHLNNKIIRVLNCQSVYPKMRRDFEEIREKYLDIVSEYDNVIKQCYGCLGFYLEEKDSFSLYKYKSVGTDKKTAFKKSVYWFGNMFPPIHQLIWNNFGFAELSSGICKICNAGSRLGDLVRLNQLKEGYNDCFGRKLDDCPYKDCTYIKECIITTKDYKAYLKRIDFLDQIDCPHFKVIPRY